MKAQFISLQNYLILLSFIFGKFAIAQDLAVFNLYVIEDKNYEQLIFSSFSDVYRLSEHPDSSAVPDTLLEYSKLEYLELKDQYRSRFLVGVDIQETDHLYLYNYTRDSLISFSIQDLKVIAALNIYSSGNDDLRFQNDYMIGFEIDPNLIIGFGKYFEHVLVCTGTSNPFIKSKMHAVKWERDEVNPFPEYYPSSEIEDRMASLESGTVYTYSLGSFRYYLRDKRANGRIVGRHIVVVNIEDPFQSYVLNKVLFAGESASYKPLNSIEDSNENEQWTGELFRNKPKVLFGFLYHSFGCEGIDFLKNSDHSIVIYCDNRH